MHLHRIFKLKFDDLTMALIPSLSNRIELFNEENAASIPAFKLSSSPAPGESCDPSLVVFVLLTDSCNIACQYCYGFSRDERKKFVTMSESVMDRMLVLVKKKLERHEHTMAKFVFFGGEPTHNWKVLLRAVDKIKTFSSEERIEISISMSTNGFFKKDKLCFLMDNFDRLSFSVDGFPDIHDRQRPDRSGGGTFSVIDRNLKELLGKGYRTIDIRVTITPETVTKMLDISKFLSKEYPGVLQNYEPVMQCDRQAVSVDIQQFVRGYIEIFKFCRETGQTCTTSLFDFKPQSTFCGINNRISIFPDGSISGCHRVNRDDQDDDVFRYFHFGTVFDDFEKIEDRQRRATRGLDLRSWDNECTSCFASFFCRGGCYTIKLVYGLNPRQDKSPWCEAVLMGYKELLWSMTRTDV